MYIPKFKVFITSLLYLFSFVSPWDLSNLEIEDNYFVSNIAVYLNRAYLAIPRSACQNKESYSTLVEVQWMGEHQLLSSRRQPSEVNIGQTLGKCEEAQDVISLDIEPHKSRLWILDKGSLKCSPKILIYNVLHNEAYSTSLPLDGVPYTNLNTLVIDPSTKYSALPLAYIGDAGEDILIVLSLNEIRWWKVKLNRDAGMSSPISAFYMAASLTEAVLYMSGNTSRDLYSLDLYGLRYEEEYAASDEGYVLEINVTYHGEKLGSSVCLETDVKGGVIYFLKNDYALVRWNSRGPLIAEFHDVLAQSYERLPYVSQIFTGPQFGIWGLLNYHGPEECELDDEKRHLNDNAPEILENRVVKIMKYNMREKIVL